MATNLMKCPLCGSPSLTFKLYVSHLRLVHSNDPAFNIMCGVDGCREVFGAFSAFNSHVYRHHRAAIGVGTTELQQRQPAILIASEIPGPSFQDSGSEYNMPEEVGLEVTMPNSNRAQLSQIEQIDSLKTATAARFILRLREGRQISQAAISDVTTGCKNLSKQAADEVKVGVKATLLNAGITWESIPGLTEVLDKDPDPFQSIDSNYLFEKFCTEHLGYLVSQIFSPFLPPPLPACNFPP